MIRFLVILGLIAAVLALAAFEQVYVGRTYDRMKSETSAILSEVYATAENPDKEAPFSDDLKNRIDTLHRYWMNKEPKMCALTRHMELSYISDALIYARNFIHNGNKEEAAGGLERLSYLLDTYSHIYSVNGWNIL